MVDLTLHFLAPPPHFLWLNPPLKTPPKFPCFKSSFSCPIDLWWFSHGFAHTFPCFSTDFPLIFHWFSIAFHWFSTDFPLLFPWFSIDFPLIFHWFSTDFPLLFHWFSMDFPMDFPAKPWWSRPPAGRLRRPATQGCRAAQRSSSAARVAALARSNNAGKCHGFHGKNMGKIWCLIWFYGISWNCDFIIFYNFL